MAGSARKPNRTKDQVRRLRERGLGQREIARELGLAKSTVTYHFRTLGEAPDERFSRRYDWNVIRAAYEEGMTALECIEHFGCSRAAWSQAVTRGDIVARERAAPLSELLVADRRCGRWNLKRRLLEAGLKTNRCERCGLEEWLGEPLNMALHHVNGDGLDNRLENLVLLCPNCHAQTPNYGGRNGHRRKPGGGSAEPGEGMDEGGLPG